ncbi:MAG: HesA/MoeB/ThiF family protein [Anaerolineae bacterium]|nr:HesA/MoeB/ThiF family protein [Anaerolineae bacterium]
MSTEKQSLEQTLQEIRERSKGQAFLSLQESHELAQKLGIPLRQVEITALKAQVAPERYRRNLGTIGFEGQVKLLESTVAVVGAGGLGGWVIEGLARMGVGHLILIDGDRFQENNLNRQLGCTEKTLGRLKVECLAERVRQVNGAVQVTSHPAWLTKENATALLQGAQVAVDALDTLPARLLLEEATKQLGIPLVHGSIGGYMGQVMTIFPEDPGLHGLYDAENLPERGIEVELGNPAATPMMISSWQIQEVVKLLTGKGQLLRRCILMMDAESGEITKVQLS